MGEKHIRVVAGVVEQEGRYLITQRREHAVLPLHWEFPGGRVEDSETDEAALARELGERLGATKAAIVRKIGERHHQYERYTVDFALYSVKLDPSQPLEPRRVREFRWVASAEFEQYKFCDADQKTMDQLLGIGKETDDWG